MKEHYVIDLLIAIFAWIFLISLAIIILWGIYSILAVFNFHFIAIVSAIGIISALSLSFVLSWKENIYR